MTLSRQASDLATLAPYLLTLDSPFRIAQEGKAASALVDALQRGLPVTFRLQVQLDDTRKAIGDLVRDTSLLRQVSATDPAAECRTCGGGARFAALLPAPMPPLPNGKRHWACKASPPFFCAGRAERPGQCRRIPAGVYPPDRQSSSSQPCQGPLRPDRHCHRARGSVRAAAAGTLPARSGPRPRWCASGKARRPSPPMPQPPPPRRSPDAAERDSHDNRHRRGKSTLLAVVAASAALALAAALYVSGHVTANLHAISDP